MPKTLIQVDLQELKSNLATPPLKSKFSDELNRSALGSRRIAQFDSWALKGENDKGATRQGIQEDTAQILWNVMCAIGWDPSTGNGFLFQNNGTTWKPAPKTRDAHEYQIAGVAIPGISILQSFVDEPVAVGEIQCSFSSTEQPDRLQGPVSWSEQTRSAYTNHWSEKLAKVEERRNRGEPARYHNDLLAALESWYGHREQTASGSRIRPLNLTLGKTWYYQFDFVQTCLRACRDRQHFLGNPLSAAPEPQETEALDLPQAFPYIPFRIGVGTVVLSADEQVVVPVRSKRPTQGGPGFAISAGEGMLARDKNLQGRPCIGVTSIRALREELGLSCEGGIDFSQSDLKVLGFMLDWRIGEPFFSVLVKTKRRFDEIRELWRSAVDRWEHDDVLGVRWNQRNGMMLLSGKLRVKTKVYTAASPREQANYGMALKACFPKLRRE